MAAGKQREKAWSLAAAARAAREARIAAVRYMREAAIEREWHAAVLSYGHQARAARSGNPDGARALVFATMGYPPAFPDGWDQASAMMLAGEVRYLAGADLYVLTPQMLDVVIAAAQSLTFADLALLREDDLPSPSGAVVLPRPLVTRHPSGSLAPGDRLYLAVAVPGAPSRRHGLRAGRAAGGADVGLHHRRPAQRRLRAGGPRAARGPAAPAAGGHLVPAAAPGHPRPGT